MIYPPYCELCVIAVRAKERENAKSAIDEIFRNIKEKTAREFSDVKLIILGPTPASVPKINDRYRYRMLIKCRVNKHFRQMLREALSIKPKQGVTVSVDIAPETVI